MTKRTVTLLAGALTAALALAGCGDSVAAGGANAAVNPASGIWVSNTIGGGNISGHPNPTVPLTLPASRPPASPVPGVAGTISALKSAVTGGCWEDSHAGNLYGAYDQLFWWRGHCGDTQVMVTAELYPSAAEAASAAGHPSATGILGRYRDGAVLIDVWANAPLSTNAQVAGMSGVEPVPGYGG